MVDYPWPPPSGCSEKPVWTGGGFRLGKALVPVLCYNVGRSGWTGELTRFHEETAGSDHSIDRASRRHALEQIRKYLKGASPVILEVGCSSGFMLRLLREHLPNAFVMGSDYVREPLEQLAARMRDVPLLQFDLVKCPLPEKSLDAVVLLNVLEHIQDDAAALRQVHHILKPGGIAVIEVPSGPHLYDVYDKMLLHCRRYSLAEMRRLANSAGFRVIERSHLGFCVYPAFWLAKQCNKRFLAAGEALQQEIVARNIHRTKKSLVFDVIMQVELALGRYISYPFGIRCVLTCIKMPQGNTIGNHGEAR